MASVRSWLVPLVFFAACDPSGVAIAVPRLEVPASVTFDAAPFGATTSAEVLLRNVGTADAVVSISDADPFVVPDATARVPAGEDVRVLVLFTPDTYEAASATITVTTSYEELAIAVSADVDRDRDDDGHDALDAGGDDCDDVDEAVFPGADELCDGDDQDCDGASDEDAVDRRSYWPDGDDDGWGSGDAVLACSEPSGHANRSGDCADADASISPGAAEVWYDDVDQDCSGGSDHDADGDGYENAGTGGDDCVDSNPSIHPGAADTWYDGIDQDCGGEDDYDADGDGFRADVDCDDADASVFPGAGC
jgi:hypothetical protein